MSQSDWTAEQKEVHADLLEDGTLFTFTHEEKGVFDPISGTYTGGGTTTFSVPGIVKLPSSKTAAATGWEPGTTIQASDKILLISAGAGYEPKLEDGVTVAGVKLKVKGFTALEPGQTPLIFYVLAKKV